MDSYLYPKIQLELIFPFPITGFYALRFDRTHSRSGILFPDRQHASGGIIIFVRQGLSFSELSTTSLSSLDPYSDYVGINISLNNSSWLSYLNVYASPIRFSLADSKTSSFSPLFFSPRKISSFWWTLIVIIPSGTQNVVLTPVSNNFWLPFSQWPRHSNSSASLFRESLLSSHLLCFILSYSLLLLGGALKLGLWSLANSTNCPSFCVFSPQRTTLFLQFSESSVGCFCFPCYSLFLSDTECGQVFFSFRLHQTPLKPGGFLKWKKRHVKDLRLLMSLIEVIKIIRLTFLLPACIVCYLQIQDWGTAGDVLIFLSLLNLCILSCVLLLALLPHFPPLLTFLTVLLPGSQLRSTPTTWDSTFLFSSQRPCLAEPETTCPSSAEPSALRSLIRPFALLFPLLNFSRLLKTSARPLLLA